jgi:GGDEF domain-containing protein
MMKVVFKESILSGETKKLYLEKIHNILSEILRGYDMFKMLDNDIFFIALPHTTCGNSEIVTEKITKHLTNISLENSGMINFFFGISSLGSDKNSLTKDLQCESVENYFNIKEPQTADWEKIGETKNNMVLKLRQYAEKALQKAVSENIKTIKYSDMI